MNIESYLKRINYHGPLTPTAETLRDLQLAHLLNVPFENLSIHSDEAIVLDDEALFKKIVDNRRGGFCYEVNGLFAALLRALGFRVSMLAAEVANAAGEFGPEFDHMTLMVTLDQRWLVDVGFGESFMEPLLLDERAEQVQANGIFQIVESGEHLLLRRRYEDWRPLYRFTLQPHEFADYDEMCRYHQTSPESHFTKGRICSLATQDGRITLSDMRLITTGQGGQGDRQERSIEAQDEYERILRDQFGIVMK